MDWPISNFVSQTSNGKLGIAKSFNSATGSNFHFDLDPSCGVWNRSKTTLVSWSTPIFSIAYILHRYIPPRVDREKSSIENSQNTALFLISCYEYILSGIVLSVGPPFRQAISHNRKPIKPLILASTSRTYADIKSQCLSLWLLSWPYYSLRICWLTHPHGWQTSCN